MTDILETFPQITLTILIFCFGLAAIIGIFPPLDIQTPNIIFNGLYGFMTHWLGNFILVLFMIFLILRIMAAGSQQQAGKAHIVMIIFGAIVLLKTATTHGQLALFLT